MKHYKLFFTILLGYFLSIFMLSESNAQNVELRTQAAVNTFGATNPTTIAGGLYIVTGADITDLTPLSTLTSVGGNLNVSGNAVLSNLDGLSGITSVGGSIYMGTNAVLVNLDGLSGITSVGSIIYIYNNPNLTEFCGLYPLLNSGGLVGAFTVVGNASNPTETDIINGGPCYVPTPEDLIDDLQSSVVDLDLPNGLENSLSSSLNNAMNSLQNGNTGAAINKLEAFINKVEAQRGKKIDEADANELIADAQAIINLIQSTLSKSSDEQTLTSGDTTPQSYSLDQNFPNPFNPTTQIKYGVPEASNVKIEIFSVTGEVVATLVNEIKSEGYHTVSFNASNLSSGMYLYRISAGSFIETKKMILLR